MKEKKKEKNSQQVWHVVVLWSTRRSQRYKHAGDATLQPRCNLSRRRFYYCVKACSKNKIAVPVILACPASLSDFAGNLPLQVLLRHLLGAAGLARTSPPSPFSCFLKITSGGKLHSRRARGNEAAEGNWPIVCVLSDHEGTLDG